MGLLDDFQKIVVDDFRGPWPLLELGDIPITNATQARNVEYIPGSVKTRFGFGTVNANSIYTQEAFAMQNWLPLTATGPKNVLIVYSPDRRVSGGGGSSGVVDFIDLTANLDTGNFFGTNNAGVGAVFGAIGPRLFQAVFDANGLGVDGGFAYAGYVPGSTSMWAELLFNAFGKFTLTDAGTTSGSGACTPGTHRFGVLLANIPTGYQGPPGPYTAPYNNNTTFVPLTITTDTNAPTFHITLTPIDASNSTHRTVQIVMTTTTNLNKYFVVPGVSGDYPAGSAAAINFTISISDADLAATGVDATAFFTNFANPQGTSTPVFKPSFIGEYNNRIFYITVDSSGFPVCYISDPNFYMRVTADQHAVYLPGQRQLISAFVLYRSLFLVGPHWTYTIQDTGDIPANWSSPFLVDGSIGTLAPRGVAVNASTGFAWVADVNGLYLFLGGAYSHKPISYYVTPDWKRINWAAAAKVQVVDNKDTLRVHVLVPLDGATSPSHIMTFDYTRGLTPEEVNYSLDDLNGAGYNLGSIAVVQNDTTKRIETWVGSSNVPGSAQPILRQMNSADTNPYRDDGAGITTVYGTSALPGLSSAIYLHHGDHLRLQGNGVLNLTATSLDSAVSVPLATISLVTAPAALYLRRYDMITEAVIFTLSMGGSADVWFQLSEIDHLYSLYAKQRST